MRITYQKAYNTLINRAKKRKNFTFGDIAGENPHAYAHAWQDLVASGRLIKQINGHYRIKNQKIFILSKLKD